MLLFWMVVSFSITKICIPSTHPPQNQPTEKIPCFCWFAWRKIQPRPPQPQAQPHLLRLPRYLLCASNGPPFKRPTQITRRTWKPSLAVISQACKESGWHPGEVTHPYMGVSKSNGTPKSSILGYPYFWKHPYICLGTPPKKKKVYNFMTPVETCCEKNMACHITSSTVSSTVKLWNTWSLGERLVVGFLDIFEVSKKKTFLPSSKHSSWNWTLWRYISYWKWRYSITILLMEEILHQLRCIPLFAGFISWWVRRILLFSSSDMSSRILQNLQMHQNHQKSVQTLVDGAIFWMIVISGNLVGCNWIEKPTII